MPGKQHDELLAILEAANNEPIGIVLVTNDPVRCRAALYRARMAENSPLYADLQFRVWPYEDGDLIVCHDLRETRSTSLTSVDLGGILDLDLE